MCKCLPKRCVKTYKQKNRKIKMPHFIKNILYFLFFLLFTKTLVSQENMTFLFEPSGKYDVGTTELFLSDSGRMEMLKKFHNGYRRLYVKVWYPATKNENQSYSKYLSNYDSKTIYDIFKSKKVSIQDVDSIKQYYTHSKSNLEISKSENHYPVIIFNSGYYFGITDLYTTYMEELASNGFVVFSIIHPYHQPLVIFPGGEKLKQLKKKSQLAFLEWVLKERTDIEKIIPKGKIEDYTKKVLKRLTLFDKIVDLWVADNQFLLSYLAVINNDSSDFFYSKLDLKNIGVFGQSLGGSTAGQLSLIDERVKAGINIDCFQFGNIVDNDLETPFMLIESEYQKKWNLGNQYVYSHIESDFYSLLLLNSNHFIFTDAPLLPILSKEQQESFFGKVDEKKTMKTINNYILSFFNLYLKNISSELLMEEIANNNLIYKVRSK